MKVFALLAAAAIATAAPAAATPGQDATFLNLLDEYGITYTSPNSAVTAAYGVCRALDAGHSLVEVTQAADAESALNLDDTAYVVAAAVNVYCPQYRPTGHADIGQIVVR